MHMILSFQDKETEKIWNQQYSRKFPIDIQRIGLRKLIIISRAKDLNDLIVPPGNRLERLSGKRQGQYSIRINDQFRICFTWENSSASLVEITDYH
jgi:toxin HigB-1